MIRHLYKSLILLILTIVYCLSPLYAQELDENEILTAASSKTVPDSLEGWEVGWNAGLNGSQATFENWSQGGVNSVTLTSSTVFDSKYRKNQFVYRNSVNIKYGQTKVDDDDFRKTDDKLEIGNRFDYFFSDVTTFYADIKLRTQFDKGFDFPDDDTEILISNFFAPGYFTESIGISYQPVNYFSVETGMGFKQTIVRIDSLAPLYGVDAGDNTRLEAGWAVSINFSKEIFENVSYSSNMDSFTSLDAGLSSTDVYWSNEIIGSINDIMNATFQLDLLYDDDITSQLQLKQVISIGVAVNIL